MEEKKVFFFNFDKKEIINYVEIVHYVKKSFIYKIKIFASYFIINENIKKNINC